MFILFALSLIVASVSFTISVTSIFKPVRTVLSKIHPKVEELAHCPYCLGHYVAFILLSFVELPVQFSGSFWISYFSSAFAVMGMVALMHFFIVRAYQPIMEMEAIRKQLEMQENENREPEK